MIHSFRIVVQFRSHLNSSARHCLWIKSTSRSNFRLFSLSVTFRSFSRRRVAKDWVSWWICFLLLAFCESWYECVRQCTRNDSISGFVLNASRFDSGNRLGIRSRRIYDDNAKSSSSYLSCQRYFWEGYLSPWRSSRRLFRTIVEPKKPFPFRSDNHL